MDEINKMDEEETAIAREAARVLQETFIVQASKGPVVYVENDTVMRTTPDGEPVLIKRLSGRVPGLSQRVRSLGTIKLKKQKTDTSVK